MNKKVMALAVAGALAAPAAALAQVQIGGSLTILWYSHDPDNDSASSGGDILEASEPELYVRSSENLGGGLTAWFQCASSLDGFVGGAGDAAGFCARNSAFGFQGSFGNAFLGNWDTPSKLVQNRIRGWFSGTNALVGGSMRLLANSSASGATNPNPTTAAASSANNSFYRRQANSVNYHSPNWGGFSLAAAFSANNESTGIPDATGLTPRLLGINGVYASGPFWVGLAYEKHDDYNPAGQAGYTGGTDDNLTIGAGYRFGGFNARVGYGDNTYEINGAATQGQKLEATAWAVFADWNIQGPHTIHVGYATLDDIEGNSAVAVGGYRPTGTATGADWMSVAYSYRLSKRTELGVAYNQMDNDTNARLGLGKVSASAGGKQTSVGVLVKHRF